MARASHKALFGKFRDNNVISQCEQYAKWTLPYLMADAVQVSSSGRVIVERDFQEVGALLTNNLASKLTRLLFPTQYPFFKASASGRLLKLALENGLTADELGTRFAKMEMKANDRLFLNSGYAALILTMKHLIVTGNVLLHRDSAKGVITAYGLQNFVTRRDSQGGLLDCILREFTTVEALPEELQQSLRAISAARYGRPEQSVEKYTRIHRDTRNGVVGYYVSQEVDTIPVGAASWYPANLCPWMCPTWSLIPGEHYGRGMVEDYAGGFARLSALSEAAALYGIEIMRVVHLVGAGASDIDDLAEAESGEWRRGEPNSVEAHEAGDARKLQVVEAQLESVISRLSRAFMYTGATRDAERVTAFELQLDAQEADYGLGGVYSTLSGGIQLPLAHILLTEVDELALPGIVSGELSPDITAGIPALGRSSDVQNLLQASQELAAVFPITQADDRIDPQRLANLVFAGRSIDTETIFYTPEEHKQIVEARQAAAAAQQAALQAEALAGSAQTIEQTLGA